MIDPETIKSWLNPGAKLDRDDEPWPLSPVAPISERARQAFRNIGIMD